MNARFTPKGQRPNFSPRFHPERLADPLHWRKPRRVLVAFNGDLFGPEITDKQIAAVFGVMAACPAHQFLVLTKRAERMAHWFEVIGTVDAARSVLNAVDNQFRHTLGISLAGRAILLKGSLPIHAVRWPLPNVLLGVSVTNQTDADERIPHLLRCPAAVRWVSAEPLCGALDLRSWLLPVARKSAVEFTVTQPRLDWVVAGAMSGAHAEPCDFYWPRNLRDDCAEARVLFAWKNPTGYPPLDGVVHDALPTLE